MHLILPDVVEPWGSSHGELSRSTHSPGDAEATPQVVIGKCPSEKAKAMHLSPTWTGTMQIYPPGVIVVYRLTTVRPQSFYLELYG
ncbi:jg6478 [Pararge aegeria aegeria]|uniref:Jg6478 protein n=1 Tax=Pararge aegeria aegeria TaxID=348720 RepID=A0A8S4SRY2_9NEOP|nr:jg6478 [Pararge aegeria aegeria]